MASTRRYPVHRSDPCATVEKARELEGAPFKRVEDAGGPRPLVMR